MLSIRITSYNVCYTKLLRNLLFLIAAPNTEDNVHLDVLSRLSVLLMNDEFVGKLKNAKSVDEFVRIIDDTEKAEGQKEADVQTGHKFLAVTACPTGIAHTYMAAESLEKAAKAKGYSIKVETRGRITSYNVCYTKLLRIPLVYGSGTQTSPSWSESNTYLVEA